MNIQVINVRQHGFIGKNKIYIGRHNRYPTIAGSPLANPFIIGIDGDRNQVISLYRKWLWDQLQFDSPARRELLSICDRIRKGESLSLTCWCHPLPCHGDIIIRCIKWMIAQGY
ncbi:DUF4326 domain-containing protein [Kamptonema animale CS-326]|jgi:hypothetical protein|uniref:DUF4326 domain-containing protein n=1 Tax=Kamptonema animale TaxID=92934 RepID=UPI00232A7EB1|nr:DUF4326 domain-containing protein [Kamptonema animale]MDB9513912.1 DUF4326 domain-containing protein [Kamptonema animale CS-326]